MAPITSWEGMEAVFTFADKPGVVGLVLAASVVVTIYAIYATAKHENESYIDYHE